MAASDEGYQHIEHGFEPVFDERSRVLVLGSFPSVLSRANAFYYGNPQNRFWRVMESCDIKGSSDASIRNVVPAHIECITDVAPIEQVICNGGTAGRLYKRYLQERTGLPAIVLPSTSPANAAWRLERLVERWRESVDWVAL